MPRNTQIATLEQALGYHFKDPNLLTLALTHSSYANESRAKRQECESNERLEFLGDAVLQMYISDHLYTTYPRFLEGQLTKMRQFLVCESTLAKLAQDLHLGDYLYVGNGEEKNHGRTRPSILANTFEAVLAAIYLDSHSIDNNTARHVLYRLMADVIKNAAHAHTDYKTQLQQFVQQDGIEKLSYETIEERGPAHQPFFRVEARINSNTVGVGEGKTKQEAEQNAARQALELFGLAQE